MTPLCNKSGGGLHSIRRVLASIGNDSMFIGALAGTVCIIFYLKKEETKSNVPSCKVETIIGVDGGPGDTVTACTVIS